VTGAFESNMLLSSLKGPPSCGLMESAVGYTRVHWYNRSLVGVSASVTVEALSQIRVDPKRLRTIVVSVTLSSEGAFAPHVTVMTELFVIEQIVFLRLTTKLT